MSEPPSGSVSTPTTVPAPSSTAPTPMTSITAVPTSATTTTRAATPTTIGEKVEISVVVDWVQRWLDDRFARSGPPEGVTGADQLRCPDTGDTAVGAVFACISIPQTEPGFQLDSAGVVVYVLDTSGTAVWTAGTDVPATTADLNAMYGRVPHGLFCRDLLSPDTEAGIFSGPLSGRHEEDAFFWSLVYWSLESRPSRMDADGNDIPCETLFDPDVVSGVLEGGPVPFLVR